MTKDTRNSTHVERFTDAIAEAIGNPNHLEDVPTLIAAMDAVEFNQEHFTKLQKEGRDPSMLPVYSALTFLGTIIRGMIPTVATKGMTDFHRWKRDFKKAHKGYWLTGGHYDYKSAMFRVDQKYQKALVEMWNATK